MKYLKSENSRPLKEMSLTKVRLLDNGTNAESIWVVRDGNKCYLQNHCLNLYPYPSWGLELDYALTIDIAELKGESPDTAVLTVHEEAFTHISKYLDSEGIFDFDKFSEDQKPKGDESN